MTNYKFDEPKIEKEFQEIEKEVETGERFQPISFNQLIRKEFSEAKWIVGQLIPVEGIVAISGVPSAYKTWFILDLAIKVAGGGVLFSKFETKKCGVLFIDEETSERWIQPRIQKLSSQSELPIHFLSMTGFKLTDETTDILIKFIKEHEIGVLIFDSLVRIIAAKDENSSVEMQEKVFRLFRKLTNEGVAIIFTHHHRKQGIFQKQNFAQDMRGSSDILAVVDCHLALDPKQDSIVVTQAKSRHSLALKPFTLNIVSEENRFSFEYAGEIDDEQTRKTDFMQAIKELLTNQEKPMYKGEIFQSLKSSGVEGGKTTFKTAMETLISNGELFEKRGERNKVFCSLKPFEENQMLLDKEDSE